MNVVCGGCGKSVPRRHRVAAEHYDMLPHECFLYCGARTTDGRACLNSGNEPGHHCTRHGGPRRPAEPGAVGRRNCRRDYQREKERHARRALEAFYASRTPAQQDRLVAFWMLRRGGAAAFRDFAGGPVAAYFDAAEQADAQLSFAGSLA